MIMININEAKANLSYYMSLVEKGEKVIFCRRNVPIAEVTKITKPKAEKKRKLGLAKGKGHVPKEFFDPLPKEILKTFYGKENDS